MDRVVILPILRGHADIQKSWQNSMVVFLYDCRMTIELSCVTAEWQLYVAVFCSMTAVRRCVL